ncbi:hypothetical protein SPRG_15949 [Saprolegnia parasitica CBS 223.65]|uniref:Cilia- and flagella-associated protein 45 n=1 Tax=Saprolegnia parasitica (strain CBS 223.65) TaxID=695850 RepID=A0A067BWU6_SAPPC|nr:hypothetical protein SPRG_15949 [Saprolegnia parasitica CBS 223.65]KDO18761.1 hypothetical protein SPRG_15949 [Saprolegnia parasitica CBS 223.65]|eukprot:XP_012210539.1 hypothetical protein SPRG_15949 [Saprolegnia parasitica CBS 223.65]
MEQVASARTQGTSSSRRYRRLASKESVDDALFGRSVASRDGDRSRQAGRDIVRGSSNQEAEPPVAKKKNLPTTIATVLPPHELSRIRGTTRILSDAEREAMAAKKEEDNEKLRIHARARKQHMMERAAEAATRAPKSDIEQIFDAENDAIRKRAAMLKDQAHDSVKLMKTLGARAAAFTIRDEQIKRKHEIEEVEAMRHEKLNVMMEIDRLQGLKRQEEVAEAKRLKRIRDREVLEDQIRERKLAKEAEQKAIEKEAEEMLQKIRDAQRDDERKEKEKFERANRSMEEIKRFNESAMARKADQARLLALEEEKVVAYQRKKAEDARLREEDEARKRHEAELRCAKLRSTQEKAANEKAQLDELRAKRAAERASGRRVTPTWPVRSRPARKRRSSGFRAKPRPCTASAPRSKKPSSKNKNTKTSSLKSTGRRSNSKTRRPRTRPSARATALRFRSKSKTSKSSRKTSLSECSSKARRSNKNTPTSLRSSSAFASKRSPSLKKPA